MKKIILASVLFFTALSFANAQQTPAKVTEKKHVKATTTTTVKDADKNAKATTSVTTATDKKAVKTNTTGMKKDGTPDMRMKQNKATSKTTTTTKVKKDGTPDMRYKENKKK